MLTEHWQKSSFSSTDGSCTEVRQIGELIQVRNSNDPDGPILSFTKNEWTAFLSGVTNDEFDLT